MEIWRAKMKTELKAVEMLQEIAIRLDPFDNKIELALLDGVFAELAELTQKVATLEALADNPNIAMTYREFLKSALGGKIDYTLKG